MIACEDFLTLKESSPDIDMATSFPSPIHTKPTVSLEISKYFFSVANSSPRPKFHFWARNQYRSAQHPMAAPETAQKWREASTLEAVTCKLFCQYYMQILKIDFLLLQILQIFSRIESLSLNLETAKKHFFRFFC